jgi:hypothetical protein
MHQPRRLSAIRRRNRHCIDDPAVSYALDLGSPIPAIDRRPALDAKLCGDAGRLAL